jgi:NAD(P)-dependent dehydrogenase (short-subunit alcohol dehydrogenase family)
MDRFDGRLAVVTGGGTGMGRELVRQLAAAGCDVATCDVSPDAMDETRTLCAGDAPGSRVTTHLADVSDEAQVMAFRDAVARDHATDHVHLLFNNAGIAGGGSFVAGERDEWDRTFGVCWNGVYYCTRAFMPMLLAAEDGHVVNTSSVNGLWASIGPRAPHTAYSSAKFAVRGFTEALIADFRVNAPHLRASVVLPGHVGTSIVMNSSRAHGREPKELTTEQLAVIRERLERSGIDTGGASDDELRLGMQRRAESFRDRAPLSAAEAATIILDGVKSGAWRILVGSDAVALDELVREHPEEVYDTAFMDRVRAAGLFGFTADDGRGP